MATPAGLSNEELAAQYGFAYSFMNSDPSLKQLFNDAVKNNYSSPMFVAKLRATTWFRKNADSARQYAVLKSTDPATLAQRRSALMAQIRDSAAAMGAVVPTANLNTMVENALMFNWNSSQMADVLSGYVKTVNGVYNGKTGSDVATIRSTAWRNGVNLGESTIQSMATQLANGGADVSFFQNYIRNQAKSLAPGYATQLDAGMDLYDIANPYIQAKAKILEMNPANIDLFDPDVRGAISGTTADGKPASMSLWQFEQKMRQDPRWLTTSNANDSVMSIGHKVLQDFGFAS